MKRARGTKRPGGKSEGGAVMGDGGRQQLTACAHFFLLSGEYVACSKLSSRTRPPRTHPSPPTLINNTLPTSTQHNTQTHPPTHVYTEQRTHSCPQECMKAPRTPTVQLITHDQTTPFTVTMTNTTQSYFMNTLTYSTYFSRNQYVS